MPIRCLWLALSLAGCGLQVGAQSGGSISGRVVCDGKPVVGVGVTLWRFEGGRPQAPPTAKTDEDGRYLLTNLTSGRYLVTPLASGFYLPESDGRYGQPGKAVTLGEGETIEGVDLTLSRGGVITGRVTDAKGRALISEQVQLYRFDKNGRLNPYSPPHPIGTMLQTDDRGIYRIYGLPPARYAASIGRTSGGGGSGGRRAYLLTFYPGVADETQAGSIEVAEGSEVANIDIAIGQMPAAYRASGRIVDGDSGQPLPNLSFTLGAMTKNQGVMRFGGGESRTDARGEFRIENLLPGRYGIKLEGNENSPYYSDAVYFEVKSDDVSGLLVRASPGASLSGVVTVEGVTDPTALAALAQMRIGVYYQRPANLGDNFLGEGMGKSAKIDANGSFQFIGLPPGAVNISLMGGPANSQKGFTVRRVEGVAVREHTLTIEIAAGEHKTGVRLVLAYGTSVVRGQVQFIGGTMPPGVLMRVILTSERPGLPSLGGKSVEVDGQGRFLFEGVAPGEYHVLPSIAFLSRETAQAGQALMPRLRQAMQTVVVTPNADAQVKLVIDLTPGEK